MKKIDIDNFKIHKSAIQKLTQWLIDFENKKENIPICAIIYGTPGCGKTSLVYSLYQKYKYSDMCLYKPNQK